MLQPAERRRDFEPEALAEDWARRAEDGRVAHERSADAPERQALLTWRINRVNLQKVACHGIEVACLDLATEADVLARHADFERSWYG